MIWIFTAAVLLCNFSGSTWISTWTLWPLLCSWNLGNTCLEYCVISFISHLCLSLHFSDSTTCHHAAWATRSPLVLCSAQNHCVCEDTSLTVLEEWVLSSFTLWFPPNSHSCLLVNSLLLPMDYELSRAGHRVFAGTEAVLVKEGKVLQISIHPSFLQFNNEIQITAVVFCLFFLGWTFYILKIHIPVHLRSYCKFIETTLWRSTNSSFLYELGASWDPRLASLTLKQSWLLMSQWPELSWLFV